MEAWREQHKDDPPVNCEFCGTPFNKQDVRQKYCSNECKEKRDDVARRKKPEYGDCVHCGDRFLKTRVDRLYCSTKCIQEADRRRRGKEPIGKFQHKCVECGRLYYTTHPQQRYCSVLCAKQPRLREKREYNHQKRGHACPNCDKGTTKLYCSDKCRKEYEQKLLAQPTPDVEYGTCTICGNQYIPHAKNQSTCSKECAAEKNRRYAETKREAVWVAKDCERCGKKLPKYGKKFCTADCKWEYYREKLKGTPRSAPKAQNVPEVPEVPRKYDRDYSPERMRRIIEKYGVKNPLADAKSEEARQAIERIKKEMVEPQKPFSVRRQPDDTDWAQDNDI